MAAPPINNDNFAENLGEAIGYIEVFAERKIQLAKLEVAEKAAKTTATLATGIILFGFLPVFLCVLSVALGFLLVESFGWSLANSFFVLSGLYLILGILMVAFRKVIFTNPILEMVIKEIFQK
jgi:hypothetical protein